ncbi:hypothetical protein ACFVUS_24760 [Nocardia sp. NPDC058058]|uniref:nitroreductase family protein n=1 Tax=Nocardia sp. NPDC058058 TaxID=3346317 RepID=UPI0036DA00A1
MSSIAIARLGWSDLIEPVPQPIAGIEPLTGTLAAVVARIEEMIGRHGDSQARRVPSAGATYPYEILLTAADSGPLALVDLSRRQVVVRVHDRFPVDAARYRCLLVGRPWLSMRKYGPRGYLYHLLDCGHAAFNLALLSANTTGAQSFTEQFDPTPLRENVIGDILAAGSVNPPTAPGPTAGWRMVRAGDTRLQAGRTAFEKWASRISPPGLEHPIAFDSVRQLPGELFDAVPERRSAAALRSGVDPGTLDAVVADAVHAANSALAQLNLPWPGIAVLGSAGLGTPLLDGDLLTGLSGQEQLVDADAFIVLSAPRGADENIDEQRQTLLFAAGVVGQTIYLTATRHRVAVTGIGGIEPEFWNRALPPGHQAVYLLGLGHPAAGAKRDALYPGAHG